MFFSESLCSASEKGEHPFGILSIAVLLFLTLFAGLSPAIAETATEVFSATDMECMSIVAARVNRQPVHLGDVLGYTLPREQGLVMVHPGESRWEAILAIRKQELERRIMERLYTLAAAADPAVQASTDEIEQEFQALIQRFGSEEGVMQFYRLSGEEIRDLLAMNIAVRRLRHKHVIDRIQITPEQKEQYYLENLKTKFTIPPQVAVRGLFRFADEEIALASEEVKIREIRAELEEALTGLEEKEQRLAVFSGFVRAHSQHTPTRYSGGFWYIYGGHNIQPEFWKFEDAAFDTPENVLSPVVQLDNGYCLLMVDYRREARQKTYAEAEPEIEKLIQKEMFEALQEEWIESLRKEYQVEIFEDNLMCGVTDAKPSTWAESSRGVSSASE